MACSVDGAEDPAHARSRSWYRFYSGEDTDLDGMFRAEWSFRQRRARATRVFAAAAETVIVHGGGNETPTVLRSCCVWGIVHVLEIANTWDSHCDLDCGDFSFVMIEVANRTVRLIHSIRTVYVPAKWTGRTARCT